MYLEIVLEALLRGFMNGAMSESISKRIRIICMILISFFFLAVIALLLLATFLVENVNALRRVAFFLMALSILAYYLQFLKTVMNRQKGKKKP